MKKLVLAFVAVAALALALNANAEEKYVAGGFEASGHVNTAIGFDYIGKDSANAGGSAALTRDNWFNQKYYDKAKNFGFMLDEVELDVSKTFGENIKARVDLDFGDRSIGSAINGIAIEQAYVTANIPAGNGIELLVGRFDAPIGYESVDRNDNNTVTRSMLYNFNLRPKTATGMKIYYAFSDMVDWHLYAVNTLEESYAGSAVGAVVNQRSFDDSKSMMPSFGTRVGLTWGEEGTESTVGLSAAMGPEYKNKTAGTSKIGRMSWLVDLDWNIYATEAFVIGGEGLYRIDDGAKNTKKAQYIGGILDLNYAFSDVWDGTLKYSLLWQNNVTSATTLASTMAGFGYAPQTVVGGTYKALFNEISLAGGYQIADGAKLKAEYRLDYTKYSKVPKNMSHTVLAAFEYAF